MQKSGTLESDDKRLENSLIKEKIMNHIEYENECKLIEKENEAYLELFQIALVKKGLTEKTIHRHLSNVEFYLNTFNVREEADHMPAGCYKLQDFFG